MAAGVFCLAIVAAVPLRAEWLPVRDESLVVPRGSPLDFSALSPAGPAGTTGRVIVGSRGTLAFARTPDERARLNCASLAWSPATGGFPDHATAETYAEQLRIHGYNLVRFHYVEATLMTDRKADFDFDPVALDRFRYFLAALKRQGVYWAFDVLTSPNGAVGDVFPHRWVEKHHLKLGVYFDEAARRHWRRLAETLLGTVNPYTGTRPLDDPALSLLVLANENGLEFLSLLQSRRTGQAYPEELRPAFNGWLRRTYQTTDALKTAWGGLESGESLTAGTVRFPRWRWDTGPRMRDKQRFFLDLEAETFGWMERELRALGYRGLVTSYNNWGSTGADLTRGRLPVVARHGYFDEVIAYEPGQSITQRSSLDDDAGYVRGLAAARWLGRPFVVTEYGHPFWNRFRREAGLVLPAYAALQAWDVVCRHAEGAIDLSLRQTTPRKRQLTPYGVGLDPVARAGETLSALLFHRGDVAPARGVAAIPLAGAQDLIDDGQGDWPADLTAIALMTKLGLAGQPIDPAKDASPLVVVRPGSSQSPSRPARALSKLRDAVTGGGDAVVQSRVEVLRQAGLLSPGNRSDGERRVFESDTGEVLLDAPRRWMRAVTARTEAASFERLDAPRRLGVMTLQASTGPALVAVSALDSAPIAASRRMLLILATDAQNTDMRFRDGERRTVEAFGRMPILIKREVVTLSFGFDEPAEVSLRALRLNGETAERLPVTVEGSRVAFALDTGAARSGPTTFFLLERSPGSSARTRAPVP